MIRFSGALALVGSLILGSNAHAALEARYFNGIPGIGGYYDTVLNITWMRDANYAETSGFAAGGVMPFATAQTWAASLDIAGMSGWRLADIAQPDPSCSSQILGSVYANCTGGELGYMFYVEMGGAVGDAISALHNATYDLFTNLDDTEYWSDTPVPLTLDPRDLAYFFAEANAPDGTPAGYVSSDYQDPSLEFTPGGKLGWVVHDGDVGSATDVPEPASIVLLGLGTVVLVARQRKRSRMGSVSAKR